MQLKCEHRDESSWEKGDLAYELDDTLETGVMKALKAGMRPGSNAYGAFITAFSRRVRSREIALKKMAAEIEYAEA